jgi:DnaJ-class molecular chaperone
MICTHCNGKGFVPASLDVEPQASDWNGEERRQQPRWAGNEALEFREARPAARFQSCPRCEGSGKLHPNLLSV